MKKQIFLLTLLLSVAASAFAVEEVEIGGLWYEVVSKTKEATVISNKNIGDIVIPETVEYDGNDYSVTSIRSSAFYGCSGLTSVTIPNSVTSIGEGAFSLCSGLTSVTIPGSVTSIGGYAFQSCSRLTSVHISDLEAWCKIAFNNYFSNPLSYAHHLFLNEEEIKYLVIPNSVTSLVRTFAGCSGLTSVTIPGSVTSIEVQAFSGCSGLTSVTIPNSVTSIGQYAFRDCSGLTSITIPNSVTSIGEWAFLHCSSLTSVTIPNSVTSIRRSAFLGCSGLTTITIGSGVKTIYEKAFAKCPELTDVYCYAENVPRMRDYYNTENVTDAFEGSLIEYATLHVPTASIDAYKAKEPWKNFKTIMGLDGTMPEEPETQKCATPTISYGGKKLTFSCATEGVEYVSEIKDTDIKKHYDSEVQLTATYEISVYATKAGWENSNVATATLVWGTATFTETTQENTQSAAPALTLDTPALITARGGVVTVSCEAEGLPVAVYATDGRMCGSATVSNGQVAVSTSLTDGSVAIVKLGQKAVKVVMR